MALIEPGLEPLSAGLNVWEGGGPELIAPVLAAPGLGRAIRALASDMLALSDTDPALHFVFKDAGRYVVTDWAMNPACRSLNSSVNVSGTSRELNPSAPGHRRQPKSAHFSASKRGRSAR